MSMSKKNIRAVLAMALGGFMLMTQVPIWGMENEIEKIEKIEEKVFLKDEITPEMLTKWSDLLQGKDLVIEAMEKKKVEAKKILNSVLYNLPKDEGYPSYDNGPARPRFENKGGIVTFVHNEICYDFYALSRDKEKRGLLLSGLADWFVENKNVSEVEITSIFCKFAELFFCEWGGTATWRRLDDGVVVTLLMTIYEKDKDFAKKIFASLPLEGEGYTKKSFYKKVIPYSLFYLLDLRKFDTYFHDKDGHKKDIREQLEKICKLCGGANFFSEFEVLMENEEVGGVAKMWLERWCFVYLDLKDESKKKERAEYFKLELFTLPHAIAAALGLVVGGMIPPVDSDILTFLGIGTLLGGAVSECTRMGAICGGDDLFFKVGRQAKWPAIFLGAAVLTNACKSVLPAFCSKNENIKSSNCNNFSFKKMLHLNPSQL